MEDKPEIVAAIEKALGSRRGFSGNDPTPFERVYAVLVERAYLRPELRGLECKDKILAVISTAVLNQPLMSLGGTPSASSALPRDAAYEVYVALDRMDYLVKDLSFPPLSRPGG